MQSRSRFQIKKEHKKSRVSKPNTCCTLPYSATATGFIKELKISKYKNRHGIYRLVALCKHLNYSLKFYGSLLKIY